jgi:hypothetical protein
MPFPALSIFVDRCMDAAGAAHDACLTSTGVAGILLDFRERTIK